MFDILKIIRHQGRQYIPDPITAKLPAAHPGKPVISTSACCSNCKACSDICPVNAITHAPLSLHLGKCVFCSECETVCPENKIQFTPDFVISSNYNEGLIISEGEEKNIVPDPDLIRKEIKRIFGSSLKLRLVSAGSCNGCELELNACGNVNFDMGRYGIEFLASPRHCDGMVVTGPIVENSVQSIERTWEAIPKPKILILAGACAISGGQFAGGPATNRRFLEMNTPDLLIPGCPPHPLTIISGLLALIK